MYLNTMISNSIHFPANDIVFFFMTEQCSIIFIHSLVSGHLDWFNILAIVNSAAISMGVQVSQLYIDLHSFRYMARSALEGSCSGNIHSGCTNLHSYPGNVKRIFSSHPCQHVVISFLDGSHSDWDEMESQWCFD
jgi:hypothetical protein